jgi:hypothetical protein
VPFPVCCLSVSDIHSSNCRRAGSSVGSIVYILDKTEVEIEDGCGSLRSYKDSDTKSGGAITRQFCGNCGWYDALVKRWG